MKKKILLMVSMCLLILGLTACEKTDPRDVDYNGYTYDQLKAVTQNTVSTLLDISDEHLEAFKESDDELTANIASRWDEATGSDVGSYVGLSDFTITKSGKTLTCEQLIKFEKREVSLTYVYNYNSMEVEDVTIDKIYTMGEKMSQAGMNTLMGMGTVFVVLILICLVINCFKIFPYLEKKKAAAKQPVAESKDEVVQQIEKREQQQDDMELIAVIAAAIAASTGTSTDDFVVRSIKRRY